MDRILTAAEKLRDVIASGKDEPLTDEEREIVNGASEFVKKFEEAMDDDNNTANAIAAVFDLVKYSNSNVSSDNTKQFAEAMYEILTELTDVLGIILEKEEEAQGDEDYINEMIEKRAQAKKDKDFALADQIRDELLEKGIVLEDTREGTKWSRK